MKTLQTVWTIVWRSILFILLWGLFLSVVIVPFSSGLKAFESEYRIISKIFLDSTSALTVCLAAWIMVRFIDKRSFASLGFARGNALCDVGFGIVIGTLWLAASIGIAWIAGWTTSQMASVSVVWLAGCGLAVFFNALAQEVLVRSYLYQTIRSRSNPLWAIIITSLLFSAIHISAFKGAWLPAVNVFGAGILLALAYQFSGNLWMPTGIHFAWNYLLGPVLGLTVSGQDPWGVGWRFVLIKGPEICTGGAFGLEGGLIVSATIFVTIGFLLGMYQKQVPSLWKSTF